MKETRKTIPKKRGEGKRKEESDSASVKLLKIRWQVAWTKKLGTKNRKNTTVCLTAAGL